MRWRNVPCLMLRSFLHCGSNDPSWGREPPAGETLSSVMKRSAFALALVSALWVKRPPVGVVTHQLGKTIYSVAEGSVRDLGSFFTTLGQTTPGWGRDPPVGEDPLFGGGRFRTGSRVVFRHSGSNDPRLGS